MVGRYLRCSQVGPVPPKQRLVRSARTHRPHNDCEKEWARRGTLLLLRNPWQEGTKHAACAIDDIRSRGSCLSLLVSNSFKTPTDVQMLRRPHSGRPLRRPWRSRASLPVDSEWCGLYALWSCAGSAAPPPKASCRCAGSEIASALHARWAEHPEPRGSKGVTRPALCHYASGQLGQSARRQEWCCWRGAHERTFGMFRAFAETI